MFWNNDKQHGVKTLYTGYLLQFLFWNNDKQRQTWNLSTTMIELLYERVMMFKEVDFVDLDFHKVIIDNEEKTQSEWINMLIGLCENYLVEDDTGETKELEVRIWEIWSKISWYMWW